MSNARRLATWVVLDGTAYGPHSDLTDAQAARITNPIAWADDPPPAERGAPNLYPAASPTVATTDDPSAPGSAGPAVPPRAGRGSNVAAWTGFAAGHNVDIPAAADRAAIIAACEQAGVIEPADD